MAPPSIWAVPVAIAVVAAKPVYGWLLDRSGHGELLLLLGLALAIGVGAESFDQVGLKPDLGALVVGPSDGLSVGLLEGLIVGSFVGAGVGCFVGLFEGCFVGCFVGWFEGCSPVSSSTAASFSWKVSAWVTEMASSGTSGLDMVDW